MRILTRRGPRTTPLTPDEIAYSVDRIATLLHLDCLPRSAALAAMLERGGRTPALILGCRRGDDAAWTAHAWVELDGKALDAGASNYMPLARLSSDGAWIPSPVPTG